MHVPFFVTDLPRALTRVARLRAEIRAVGRDVRCAPYIEQMVVSWQ
jgi:hypothetical protein